jgi:hypothetical protein
MRALGVRMNLPDSGHSASDQAARDRESQTVSAKLDRNQAYSVSIPPFESVR